MSDERGREIEGRWRRAGSVEDEAAQLRERVSSGELPIDRLELAAALGYPPAQVAVDRPCEAGADLPGVLLELSRLGGPLLVRGMSVLTRNRLPGWERVLTDRRPHETLASIEAWLDRPDRARALRLERAAESAASSADRAGYHMAQDHPEGAYTMDEMSAVEAIARAAQHMAEVAARITLLPRDSHGVLEGISRFVAALQRAGLELTEARELLRDELPPVLLGRVGWARGHSEA